MEEEAHKKSREEVQLEAKLAAISKLESTGSASLLMGTGVGKTKTTLDVVYHFNPSELLWVTNSEVLRDEDSPQEFIKWEYDYLLDRTEFECIQTVHKWSGKHFKFVVVDEGDFTLTDKFMDFYKNNTWDYLLIVTATTTEAKRELLEGLAPVAYEITTQDAQDLGIINKFKFVFVNYDLSQVKDLDVGNASKKWKSSENEQYTYWDGIYMQKLIQYLNGAKAVDNHYKGIEVIQGFNYEVYKKEKAKLTVQRKYAANKRAEILHKLNSSAELTKKILRKVYADPNSKTIVFSTLTEQIDRICKYTYHSKNKNKDTIKLLNSGDIRVAGVCSKIDRGVNLNGVNFFVFESFVGSSTKGQQRLGRGGRLDPSLEATMYILVPHYHKRVKNKVTGMMEVKRYPTRALGWSETMFSDFRIDETNSITIEAKDL